VLFQLLAWPLGVRCCLSARSLKLSGSTESEWHGVVTKKNSGSLFSWCYRTRGKGLGLTMSSETLRRDVQKCGVHVVCGLEAAPAAMFLGVFGASKTAQHRERGY
jgi:hypothetical protein